MSESANSRPEVIISAAVTEKTFGSVWRSYCAKPRSGHSEKPPLHRALNNVSARLKYRHVRKTSFKKFSEAGYEVSTFGNGATTTESEITARLGMPESLKVPLRAAEPKVAKLRNAVLLDCGSVLLQDGRFFSNGRSKILPLRYRQHISNPALFEESPLIQIHNNSASALIRRQMRCIDLPGTHFSVRSRVYWNFAHFIFAILPLIYYEDLGAIVPGRDSVIAPPLVHPMQKAIFHRVFEGYEIVQVPLHVPLKVEELLLPASLYAHPETNPRAIKSLANRMRRIVAPYAGQGGRKICVSRRDGRKDNWRNFANVDAYETRMRELGYEVLEISPLDPESQFALWANTSDIVGIHGAGMMNMIMMPSGGNYTEIAGNEDVSVLIRCAMSAGHRVAMLEDSAVDAQGLLEIDLNRLEAMLLDAP